jgi:hypothetical protein
MPFCRLPPEPMVGHRAAATITDHLPGCVSCARPVSDLAAVSAMLANVQAPPYSPSSWPNGCTPHWRENQLSAPPCRSDPHKQRRCHAAEPGPGDAGRPSAARPGVARGPLGSRIGSRRISGIEKQRLNCPVVTPIGERLHAMQEAIWHLRLNLVMPLTCAFASGVGKGIYRICDRSGSSG